MPGALLAVALLAGCSDPGAPTTSAGSAPATTSAAPVTTGAAPAGPAESGPCAPSPAVGARLPSPPDPDSQAIAAGRSEPVEDSVFPEYGDPRVDVLHYLLDLTWDPHARRLQARATITLRATAAGATIPLALAPGLDVTRVRVDGRSARFTRHGAQLTIRGALRADRHRRVEIDYRGTPGPAPGPGGRRDTEVLGWSSGADGQVWTSQEPYGAFTWYPVNDQPADKAAYDIVVRVATARAPGFVGVATGQLRADVASAGERTTWWHLPEPAASYLTAVAIGPYACTAVTTRSGFGIGLWTRPGEAAQVPALGQAAAHVDWLETKLGPYPFAALGVVLTDMPSAMETQTMVTVSGGLFTIPGSRGDRILLHEIAHHWYGNLVTPADWRDLWLSEGMALYLQWLYGVERHGDSLDETLAEAVARDAQLRAEAGPPGRYDRDKFAFPNVYVSPALMWHSLRIMLGENDFWRIVRTWPHAAKGSGTREELVVFVEKHTGRELSAFFDAWLMGTSTPSLRG